MYRPLAFVDGMNHLGPEIPGGVVALVDALVQPFNCDMDGAGTVLLDQFALTRLPLRAFDEILSLVLQP
jgi:hypothetical protein